AGVRAGTRRVGRRARAEGDSDAGRAPVADSDRGLDRDWQLGVANGAAGCQPDAVGRAARAVPGTNRPTPAPVSRLISSVPPRAVTGGCGARTQDPTRSGATRGYEDD